MATVDDIFNAFVDANDLVGTADFENATMIYAGLEGQDPMSTAKLRDTIEFTGFIDGYERKPPQLTGGLGGPLPDKGVIYAAEGLAQGLIIERDIAAKSDEIDEAKLLQEPVQGEIDNALRDDRYHRQYMLGLATPHD